ncbi:tripartite tricarboxylate transporter substrate binding protein [Pigmentiphaga sp. YJ18]|uniref:tripartite tricarboxylate transporter substrate binding protein n=1 Tax=Pigmentiphaga sp. YJ18 TaxID=3134907 RepID=UPI00310FB802
MDTHRLHRALAGLAAFCCAASASAASYPAKPVTLVVPFGAGGITDLVARATGKALAQQLGQPVIIENKPGAGGNIAAEYVKHAQPDGYTLMFTTMGVVAVNPHTMKVPFDSFRDFTYVSAVASTPHVVAVNPSVPAKTLADLVALAREKPESLSFGTAGVGSSPYQGMKIMEGSARVTFLHVPFKSGAESVANVVGNQVNLTFEAAPVVMPFAKSGKLRALALANPERIPGAPDLPSTAELGYPDLISGSISGVIGPAALPRDIVDTLNRAIQQALKDDQFKALLAGQGTATASSTPEEFRKAVAAEYERWARIMKSATLVKN